MAEITIYPSSVQGELTPPSSKSYAQRAIAASLLGRGVTVISGLGMCDDTRSALIAADLLGAHITKDSNTEYTIKGGVNPHSDTLDVGESGLAARLFTPIASLCGKQMKVTGTGSLLMRPMGSIVHALRQLGVEVEDTSGRLPIVVCGPLRGGYAELDGRISSQFITGLLMALPLAREESVVRVGGLKSIPYVDMTLGLARQFGIRIEHDSHSEFFIPGSQSYMCDKYTVEGDWSASSSLLVAGAVAGSVTLNNLNPLSIQADIAIIEALSNAGAQITTMVDSMTVKCAHLRAFEFDATHCPDLFPSLAALAANCGGTSVIWGTERLVHKESNRAATLKSEYAKLGINIDISEPDIMKITGGRISSGTVASHNDHRIAMSLSVAALNAEGSVTISGAQCVSKSYPHFWDDLALLQKK